MSSLICARRVYLAEDYCVMWTAPRSLCHLKSSLPHCRLWSRSPRRQRGAATHSSTAARQTWLIHSRQDDSYLYISLSVCTPVCFYDWVGYTTCGWWKPSVEFTVQFNLLFPIIKECLNQKHIMRLMGNKRNQMWIKSTTYESKNHNYDTAGLNYHVVSYKYDSSKVQT